MSGGEGEVVCVTGASGYVASWLIKHLLARGYSVKATVRNLNDPRKFAHLKALEGAEERLELFEADLIEDGSFDSAIDGCNGVFHTASPVLLQTTDPQVELMEPAVKGTLNVLRSCSKVQSVRRVVVTSSIAAVLVNQNPKGSEVVVDETWFSDPAFCEENKQWYALSKTLSEEAAWKFAGENGLDMVVLHPGFIIGPLLRPVLSPSFTGLLEIMKGKEFLPSYRFVDIRDVVYAHILAFEKSSASGRYCLVGKALSHSEARQILHKLHPSISKPDATGIGNPIFQVSKKKAESLGVSFTPLEVSFKDTVESLKEKYLLNL